MRRVVKRAWRAMWRPRTLFLLLLVPYDIWVRPWIEAGIKTFVEERAGGVVVALVRYLVSPLAVPLLVLAATAVGILIHAYREELRAKRQQPDRRELAPRQHFGYQEAIPEQGLKAWKAGHSFAEDDEGLVVNLWVNSTDVSELEAADVRCEVQDEDGNVYKTPWQSPFGTPNLRGRHEFVYPHSFHAPYSEKPPLEPGRRYRVKWTVRDTVLKLDEFITPSGGKVVIKDASGRDAPRRKPRLVTEHHLLGESTVELTLRNLGGITMNLVPICRVYDPKGVISEAQPVVEAITRMPIMLGGSLGPRQTDCP